MDVGAKVGDYRIIEHIGRGGMADVWSARDESLGRMVAVKTILRNLNSTTNPVELFEREAKTIANLEHPHILPVYGFGENQGQLYIVMRFVTGGSLEDVLPQGAMTYADIVTVGRAISNALEHAHSENVVHLDLKPPNILLDSKGAPYLADFGLATVLGPEGRAQNPGSGTLLYMAPEQITSDELDHRVDIYSFSLVLFHMLTGRLPFEAMTPLAFKQLQLREDLPHLGDLNPDLPDNLTDILRHGTAADPNHRYSSVIELMQDVEEALGQSVAMPQGAVSGTDTQSGPSTPFVEIVTMVDPEQVQLQEAKDIYERARQAWANGNGRFLLSVTHFMVMSDYYVDAKKHNLSYDEAGAQMLLRGALEYDYHLEQWWGALKKDDARRWVCLHTTRSESPSARIRAFYRLETLPDSDPPKIPAQVAQALSAENDEQAMLAALKVLSYRTRLTQGRADFDVKTEFQGRMLDTEARAGLRMGSEAGWKNVTYSQEVDTMVAEIALDGRTPRVRATAARAIGRMRSARAVRYIVDQRITGRDGVLRALAYILDEAPTLPKNIEFMPRLLAWLRNTARRLVENPMEIVWAFLFAMLGGWLGMGQHIFRTWRLPQTFFDSQRVLNTLAGGLFIGFMCGVLVVISMTLPRRLRGFWPNWTRAIWTITAAYFLGQTIWWTYGWMYLNLNDVPRSMIIFAGVGTAVGLVLPTLFKMRGWLATLVTAVAMFIPLYVGASNYYRSYYSGQAPLFGISSDYAAFGWVIVYDEPQQIWTILPVLVLLFSLGFHFPALLADVRDLFTSRKPRKVTTPKPAAPVDGPRTEPIPRGGPQPVLQTEEFAMEQVGGRGEVTQPEEDMTNPNLQTALKPMDMMTKEFEMEQVGGRGEATEPEEDITNPNLQTAMKPMDAMTEEFEMGQVGGNSADQQDDDEATDWDALMSPLDAKTEEFEVGQVGDNSADQQDNDEATDWDALMSPLDETDEDDKKDNQ